VIGFDYSRIQFTPDLLPADIVGTRVWRQRDSSFELMKGPIFTNILLADEINRTPPKTQAALLEAMEERQVTIEGETHLLDVPFFVLATQNPIEQEGTYPLPEAQMDRFMLKMSMGYAESLEEESTILTRRILWRKDDPSTDVRPIITSEQFHKLQQLVEEEIYIDQCILNYVSQIVRATRTHPKVDIGSSPRGGLALLKVSRALALMQGRDFVTPDDIKTFAVDALAHRTILNIEEALEGVSPHKIIEEIVAGIPVPTEFSRR
jgi:MoxR-like ATPase